MKHYRIRSAQAMAGSCVAAVLAASALGQAFGYEITKDQMAAIVLLTATATAAWLAEPPRI